jgi:hypothetical protein
MSALSLVSTGIRRQAGYIRGSFSSSSLEDKPGSHYM